MGIKKRIHVNMHVIRKNHKTGEREPVLTVKTSKNNRYAHEVQIDGPSKVIYSPCLLYTSPSPRDRTRSRMPSSA